MRKNERGEQHSSLEPKHRRALLTRNKMGCKKRKNSIQYHRNFISRNIDGKDIMWFYSRCWTCLQSGATSTLMRTTLSKPLKGSRFCNEITRVSLSCLSITVKSFITPKTKTRTNLSQNTPSPSSTIVG